MSATLCKTAGSSSTTRICICYPRRISLAELPVAEVKKELRCHLVQAFALVGVHCLCAPAHFPSLQDRRSHRVTLQPHLGSPSAKLLLHCVGSLVQPINRQELGFQPATEYPGFRIAHRTCNRASAQGAIDVD